MQNNLMQDVHTLQEGFNVVRQLYSIPCLFSFPYTNEWQMPLEVNKGNKAQCCSNQLTVCKVKMPFNYVCLYCLNNWNVWHLPELINYWLACLLIDQKLCTHKTSNVMSGMATSYITQQYSFGTKSYVKVLLSDVYSILTISSQHRNKRH